jgi:recombination protein RecT
MQLTKTVAITKDEGTYFEFLNMDEVKQIKDVSKQNSIWNKWPGEMMKKTAIRRLSKRLPMSTDVESVIQHDDQFFDFNNEVEPEIKKKVKNVTTGTTPEKLTEELKQDKKVIETKPDTLELF